MNPIFVEAKRPVLRDAAYRGAYVAVKADGTVIDQLGEVDSLFYPRSALKLFQAMGLMMSGAADAFQVSPEEISIACASHSGEEAHRALVAAWLKRIGCCVDDLVCGPHTPLGTEVAKKLAKQGLEPDRLHAACSGKHTGFLTLARFRNHDIKGYADINHPTQQEVNRYIVEFLDKDILQNPTGIDGCQAPVLSLTLQEFAYGLARLASPPSNQQMQKAATRVKDAIIQHPFFLAGTNRICAQLIEAFAGELVLKDGAEGCFAGYLPKQGIGFALKMEDGHTRAAEIAIATILRHRLKLDHPILASWERSTIYNFNHQPVGAIEPTDVLFKTSK